MDIVHALQANDIATIDATTFAKMSFVFNAVNDGWSVRKRKDKYVFTRPHDNRKEVFESAYLEAFIKTNMSNNPTNS
tara:strand:+ start:2774 stop:3004 length:231 start_codon:yes stop_codon:yes gene_type:complete